MAFLQQKECPNQKIEENQKVLELNFLSNSNCASLDFEIYFLPANLTEPYCAGQRKFTNVVEMQRIAYIV